MFTRLWIFSVTAALFVVGGCEMEYDPSFEPVSGPARYDVYVDGQLVVEDARLGRIRQSGNSPLDHYYGPESAYQESDGRIVQMAGNYTAVMRSDRQAKNTEGP